MGNQQLTSIRLIKFSINQINDAEASMMWPVASMTEFLLGIWKFPRQETAAIVAIPPSRWVQCRKRGVDFNSLGRLRHQTMLEHKYNKVLVWHLEIWPFWGRWIRIIPLPSSSFQRECSMKPSPPGRWVKCSQRWVDFNSLGRFRPEQLCWNMNTTKFLFHIWRFVRSEVVGFE